MESLIALLNTFKLHCVVHRMIFLHLMFTIINHIFSSLGTYILKMSHSPHSSVDGNEDIVSVEFCAYVKVKMVREKNACLLKELLEDVKNLRKERDMGTESLHRYLKKNYKDQIGFFHSGRQVIAYSAETNPCQYNVASTLQGFSLRDRYLVKAFSTFPRKKILARSARFQEIDEWPMPQNTLTQSFDEGPIQ